MPTHGLSSPVQASIYLCNTLYQKFNQWRKTAAIHPALENKEIFKLFLSSCKSMRHTGRLCQLFGLEVFCRLSYSSQEIQSSLVNWKKKRSLQHITQSCFQHQTLSVRTTRACLNENGLPSLLPLRLLMSNWQNGFLLGGRSPDSLPKTLVEK